MQVDRLVRCALLGLAVFLAACSQQQVYNASQGLRQSQCEGIMDAAQREACLQESQKSFSTYDEERKAIDGQK
jgi:hypothetical protein